MASSVAMIPRITALATVPAESHPTGYSKLKRFHGRDTMTGHWEIMGPQHYWSHLIHSGMVSLKRF